MLAYMVAVLFAFGVAGIAYGHGTGSETLPPVEMDGRMVTMVVSSQQEAGMVRVDLAMVVFDTAEPVSDADFRITARHGQTQLFSQEFSRADGRVTFDLVDGAEYTEPAKSDGGFFGLLGPDVFTVAGPGLAGGGLYSFDVAVLSAGGHDPDVPPVFESAVSVPITYSERVDGGRWGEQAMQFITYYDELQDRRYDPEGGAVSFSMPFEWDPKVIEQIETVHVEFTVPGGFGDMLVESMDVYINGVRAADNTVTIDDYFTDVRTVHIVLLRGQLLEMLDAAGGGGAIDFEVRPVPSAPYSAVTANGEYRMLVSIGHPGLVAGRDATVAFNVTNVFLRSISVEGPYAAAISYGDTVLHSQNGISGGGVTMEFSIPEDVSGPATLSFLDINGNELADATLPVFIDPASPDELIPAWIRDTVRMWTAGDIDDPTFTSAISYLIRQGVIRLDDVPQGGGDGGPIDEWVRTTAGWWADGLVSDAEFLAGIKYLIGRGVIAVP